MSRAVAVIPSFTPDSSALTALVQALVSEGIDVLVADDASPCTADPVLREIADRGVTVVRHDTRAGIARSLNDGLAQARSTGADWLLTVDQDTTLPVGYVRALLTAADEAVAVLGPHSVGAMAAAAIDDASGTLGYPVTLVAGLPSTPEVIQTGTLWSVAAVDSIGGFDETLGIDGVDAAACVRLRASGRRILLAPSLSVGHRVGEGRQVRILGRDVLASGHSPERRTTIVANRIRLAREEFEQSPVHAFRTLRRVAMGTFLAVTVEDQRWAKAKASARGLMPRRAR